MARTRYLGTKRPETSPRENMVSRIETDCVIALLKGDAVQTLIGDWAKDVVLTQARSYRGKACYGKKIRLSLVWSASKTEIIVTLCHEIAHFKAGFRAMHNWAWKERFVETLNEAAALELLGDEDRDTAVRMALDGRRGDGLGDVEKREALKAYWSEQGLRKGSRISIRNVNEDRVYEVLRLNKNTVTCQEWRENSMDISEIFSLGARGVERMRIPYRLIKEMLA